MLGEGMFWPQNSQTHVTVAQYGSARGRVLHVELDLR